MMRARLSLAALPVALIALVAIAGCGGSSGTTTSNAAATTSTSAGASGGATTIDVANNPKLGQILTDSNGDTVYVFAKDTGSKSTCSGACAGVWPPVTTSGTPKAGNGVAASKLATTKRSDGSTQVTYSGHPLYTYTGDASPGDTTGNGINTYGAVWNAVQPSGANAPAGSSTSGGSTSGGSTSTSSSSGGGYGY
jgi:predicted lipoprotein with Yx(FWY)xxD motif